MPERKHLLFIDDERSILEFLRRLLSPKYRVSVSLTAMGGFEILEKEVIDLVITGYKLSTDHSGLDVLDFVREKYGDLPVIMLTGWNAPELREECKRKGAGFLTKTCDPEELKGLIEKELA